MNKISYSKEITNLCEADVLVVGGGPSGVAAAIASARNGAKTMLLEKTSMLGGMATSALVGPFMTSYDSDAKRQIIKGIFDEIVVRAEKMGGAIHPSKIPPTSSYCSYFTEGHSNVTPFNSDILQVVLDEMTQEAGVKVLFYTIVSDVVAENDSIKHVIISNKDGLSAVSAKVYVDCTGDADVANYAHVKTIFGDIKTGYLQPVSLFFEVGNVDTKVFRNFMETEMAKNAAEAGDQEDDAQSSGPKYHNFKVGPIGKFVEEARRNGEWDLNKSDIGFYETPFQGRFKINCTRLQGIDGTKTEELTKAHIITRKQVQTVFKVIKKYVPGCENAMLIQTASVLGVRESRHIVGRYTLTDEDVISGRKFDDKISLCGYILDLHSDTTGGGKFVVVDQWFDIPYRCLVPETCNNLLVAGRCISATSGAASSLRTMTSCFAIGQGAGTAAAQSVAEHVKPKDIDIAKLQNTLRSQNVVLE